MGSSYKSTILLGEVSWELIISVPLEKLSKRSRRLTGLMTLKVRTQVIATWEMLTRTVNQDTDQRQTVLSKIPDVGKWSDITWIIWKDKAGDQAGNLKYIFKHEVTTDITRVCIQYLMIDGKLTTDSLQRVMERVGGATEDKLDILWPGIDCRYLRYNFFLFWMSEGAEDIYVQSCSVAKDIPCKSLLARIENC